MSSPKFALTLLLLLAVFAAGYAAKVPPPPGTTMYDTDQQHKRSSGSRAGRSAPVFDDIETTSEYWRTGAQDILRNKLLRKTSSTKAKNVIFFIGDGMSPQTVAATRMYLGNENVALSFEQFPHFGTVKTYCVDRQVPDSACTATAYLSGVKINNAMINIGASVLYGTCEYDRNATEFLGLMKWAQAVGMATGVVTTTRVTHASPAGAYASIADRNWEDDAYVAMSCPNTVDKPADIAYQLIHGEVGKEFKVILGGGRDRFLPKTVTDEEGKLGRRADGRNLIEEWRQLHLPRGRTEYVWNKQGMQSLRTDQVEYLLGLFESDHCLYNLEIENLGVQDSEPTLSEMTEVAVAMLQKHSDKGYVLFVEGGRIDMAHHDTRAHEALGETAEFQKAIGLARQMTSEDDTLIIVSSDHSHTMSYSGYTTRGNDILGIADVSDQDNLPYTTLSYANGAGFSSTYKSDNPAERADVSTYDLHDYRQRYLATVPLGSETHGAEDVGVYASGPYAHLFSGNFEQNVIPHLIAYAAGIGEPIQLPVENDNKDDDGSAASASISALLLGLSITMALFGRL